MSTNPAGFNGGTDDLASEVPDLSGMSLEQARSLDGSVLAYAVQRVLTEADEGIGRAAAGYNPSASF